MFYTNTTRVGFEVQDCVAVWSVRSRWGNKPRTFGLGVRLAYSPRTGLGVEGGGGGGVHLLSDGDLLRVARGNGGHALGHLQGRHLEKREFWMHRSPGFALAIPLGVYYWVKLRFIESHLNRYARLVNYMILPRDKIYPGNKVASK